MNISLLLGLVLLLVSVLAFLQTKDALHPSVVFSGVWGATATSIWLGEDFGYFQISAEAFSIFLAGVLSFVVGSLFVSKSRVSPNFAIFACYDYRKILWFCVVVHVIFVPLTLNEAASIAYQAQDAYETAYALRSSSVSGEERVSTLVGNYLVLGVCFVPFLFIGWLSKKIRFLTAMALSAPWIALNVFVNGRSALFLLAFSLVYLFFRFGGRLTLASVGGFLGFITVVAVAGNVLVGKIDASMDDGFGDVIIQSTIGFFDYFAQGPILFSEYLERSYVVSSTWDTLVFSCHLLEKIGLCSVPDKHQQFMQFAQRGGAIGNVYSLFFAIYPKYGWGGLLGLSALYGASTVYFHSRAHTSLFCMLLASFLFGAMILSVFNDSFGLNFYFFLKMFVFSLVVNFVFKRTPSPRAHAVS